MEIIEKPQYKPSIKHYFFTECVFCIIFSAFILLESDINLSFVSRNVVVASLVFSMIFIFSIVFLPYRKLGIIRSIFVLFFSTFVLACLIFDNQTSFLLYTLSSITLFYVISTLNQNWVDFWSVVAVITAYFISKSVHPDLTISIQAQLYYLTIFLGLIYGSYDRYKINLLSENQIKTLRFLGGAIAHELRTPLASVSVSAMSLKKFIPIMLGAYKNHIDEVPNNERIHPSALELIPQIGHRLEKMAREGSIVVDMLLMNIKNESGQLNFNSICNASTIVQTAIEEYPLSEAEKMFFNFSKDNDFDFMSHAESMKHVLFNLMKNAIYQIKKHNRGKIEIWFERHTNADEIHFKDTAIGMKQENMLYLFDNSSLLPRSGSGIGLPFCKLVVENSSGTIHARSIHGEYLEFILRFPKEKKLKERG